MANTPTLPWWLLQMPPAPFISPDGSQRLPQSDPYGGSVPYGGEGQVQQMGLAQPPVIDYPLASAVPDPAYAQDAPFAGSNPSGGLPTRPTYRTTPHPLLAEPELQDYPNFPTRNVAAEARRRAKQEAIAGILGTLIGGARGGVAAAQGIGQGMDARFAQDNQARSLDYQGQAQRVQRGNANAISSYNAKLRQQQLQDDADKDYNQNSENMYGHDVSLYNAQQGVAQRAKATTENILGRMGLAEINNSSKEGISAAGLPIRQQNANANTLTSKANAALAGIRGSDIAADNTRADKQLTLDEWYKRKEAETNDWYKHRTVEIAQGRLNFAREKDGAAGEIKGVKTWEEAQPKIADFNRKAATLLKPKTNLFGDVTPPTAEDELAANMFIEAGRSLAIKYGREWDGAKQQWKSLSPPPLASQTVGQGDVRASERRVAPVTFSNPKADARMKSLAGKDAQQKMMNGTPSPRPATTPRPTTAPRSTPNPSATPKTSTPKPLNMMTRDEKIDAFTQEVARIKAKKGKK